MFKHNPKRVRCQSGIEGYQCRLQENYHDFEQFEAYAEMYGLHTRLGYKTIKGAWKSNPVIQGSTIPSDFRRVK
jgi:hypothetical protein